MIAIEATNEKGWRWISCIFNDPEAADKYFSQIPAELRSLQRKVQIPFLAYPFFIIEDRGFSYADIAGVTAKVDATSPAEDEDAIHFNIYVVKRDFFCLQPGGDQIPFEIEMVGQLLESQTEVDGFAQLGVLP